MLQKLVIKNYAIIDHLTLEPDQGLNTVTGETGAGKSIILGALSLILGDRADSSVLINKEEKSVIEGYFDVSGNDAFRRELEAAELDYEEQCIIRREIAISGKSRAFVNDTPVTLQVLNRLTSLLVDLQQQFAHLELGEDGFQVSTLDAIADTMVMAAAYRKKYNGCRTIQKQLADKRAQQAKFRQESDFKQYLYDELVQAGFKTGEIESSEQQLRQMSHAERIIGVLQAAGNTLDQGETPMVNELKRMLQQLQGIADVLPEVMPLHERINSVWAELKDITAELDSLQGGIALDPALMEELSLRLDLGNRMLKKHGLTTTEELLALQTELGEGLKATLDLDEIIDKLAKEAEKAYNELVVAGEQLSDKRAKAIPGFEKQVNELLALVGMPNARFAVQSVKVEPGVNGVDAFQFLLDANRSGQFQLLQKAASGGEMSRIMLCIKSLIAQALHLPTLIFDEVDTGISGEAARQVGILLRDLSGYHQVICITHQPQVAARGTRHFYVFKEGDVKGRLSTQIRVLQPGDRVMAIARMIGGEQPTEAAISSARELVTG